MDDVHEVTELITPGPAQALAGLLGVPVQTRNFRCCGTGCTCWTGRRRTRSARTGISTAAACRSRPDPGAPHVRRRPGLAARRASSRAEATRGPGRPARSASWAGPGCRCGASTPTAWSRPCMTTRAWSCRPPRRTAARSACRAVTPRTALPPAGSYQLALGVEPLGEGRAGQRGVRAGQQAAVGVERVVRVVRVADRLDLDLLAALGGEQRGQVREVFLARAGDLGGLRAFRFRLTAPGRPAPRPRSWPRRSGCASWAGRPRRPADPSPSAPPRTRGTAPRAGSAPGSGRPARPARARAWPRRSRRRPCPMPMIDTTTSLPHARLLACLLQVPGRRGEELRGRPLLRRRPGGTSMTTSAPSSAAARPSPVITSTPFERDIATTSCPPPWSTSTMCRPDSSISPATAPCLSSPPSAMTDRGGPDVT